jgi:hypothetical protein
MAYALRTGLTYCMVDGHAVFLDLPADRYFQLAAEPEAAFKLLCGDPGDLGAPIGGFPLPALLEETSRNDGLLPPNVLMATRTSFAMSWERPAVIEAVAAAFAQRRMERSLKSRGLARTMARLKAQKEGLPLVAKGGGVREGWIRGFEQAKLLRSPANRCLPRSMALADRLYRAGFGVRLVIGVRLRPFAAHCWVQDEDIVLNDTAEEVSTFTPIFAL